MAKAQRVGSEVDFRAHYDSYLGDEVPPDEGIFVSPTHQMLNLINFGDLPKFESLINENKVEMI